MNGDLDNRAKTAIAAAVAVAAMALAACGSGDSGEESAPAPAPDYGAVIAEAPPKLAEHYANGSELITGGEEAYDRELAEVRGYPVVVNHWASWCVPCRQEFPYFQSQAAARLDEVAFLGVDTEDSPDAYATFLRDNPIPYPSVEDPERGLPDWENIALIGQPNTLYYDERGELVYTHQGPYTSEADLAADIEKYALSS